MLSIILPTYNEAANLSELLERIGVALKKGEYEVIVVDDDSPDKTWEVAQNLKKQYPMLSVIRRVGRRGLSSAVTEGFDVAKGDTFAVMDADLQHDPQLLKPMMDAAGKGADVVVASRYIKGGGVGDWVKGRRFLSRFATFLAQKLPPVQTSDPMSGFFLIRAKAYNAVASQLRPTGFKILFEILSFLPASTKAAEVPLQFKMRVHGESKLNVGVEAVFLWQLLRVALRRIQWLLFWGITVVAAGVLLMRAWALAPLYLDDAVRTRVQQTLERVSEEHGWLLSDLSVRSVNTTDMKIIRRFHHRGKDELDCFMVHFENARLTPCEN